MDDREKNDVLLRELTSIGIICSPVRLKIGDYQYKEIVVESKSVDDFCLSIMDGRLKSQIQRMDENCDKPFLLVYGKIGERKTEIDENCIVGMYVSLTLKYKVKIIWVDNERQASFVMKRICERFDEEKNEK